jgi:hypothetical protein
MVSKAEKNILLHELILWGGALKRSYLSTDTLLGQYIRGLKNESTKNAPKTIWINFICCDSDKSKQLNTNWNLVSQKKLCENYKSVTLKREWGSLNYRDRRQHYEQAIFPCSVLLLNLEVAESQP